MTKAGVAGVVAFLGVVVPLFVEHHITYPTMHVVNGFEVVGWIVGGVAVVVAVGITLKRPDVSVSSRTRLALAIAFGLVAGASLWVSFSRRGYPAWSTHPLVAVLVTFTVALTASALDPRRFWIEPLAYAVGTILALAVQRLHLVPYLYGTFLAAFTWLVLGATIPVFAAELARTTDAGRRLVTETIVVGIAVAAVLSLQHRVGCETEHFVLRRPTKNVEISRAVIATLRSKGVRVVAHGSRGTRVDVYDYADACHTKSRFEIRIDDDVYERTTASARTYQRLSVSLPDQPFETARFFLQDADRARYVNGVYILSYERSTGSASVGVAGTMAIRDGRIVRLVEEHGSHGSTTYDFRYGVRLPAITPPPRRFVVFR